MSGDLFGGRTPTSHERMTGRPWDASYHEGPAPWDFGGPQPAIVRLGEAGAFTGSVLDAGCGSGENALFIASLGRPVLGFDVAETAIVLARQRAAERGLDAEFVVADAYDLSGLGRTFDTVVDSGMFHTGDAEEKPRYAASLATVTHPGSVVHVLAFGDEGENTGPHPVTQDDVRTAFSPARGWRVDEIRPERVRTRFHDEHGAPAWLATITRLYPTGVPSSR